MIPSIGKGVKYLKASTVGVLLTAVASFVLYLYNYDIAASVLLFLLATERIALFIVLKKLTDLVTNPELLKTQMLTMVNSLMGDFKIPRPR